jgi:hypothetical protein
VDRKYYLLFVAFLTSSLGNWIYRLALPLLVLELTGSAFNTALVYALEFGPFLLFSIPGGVFADRLDRQRLLVVGDVVATAIMAGLAGLLWLNVPYIWPIYIAAFLLASVEPVYHPAFQSLLPSLVDKNSLEQANAWMQTAEHLLTLAGPVVGGAVVAFLGFQVAILLDAITFAISAAAIAMIRVAGKPVVTRLNSRIAVEVREAAHYIAHRNRLLLAGSLLFTGTNFGIWLVQANFVYYLAEYRDFSAPLIGVILSGQGAGAILGAVAAVRLRKRFSPGRLILGCTILGGLGMMLLIFVRGLLPITIVWATVYALGSINVVTWFTLRQRIVPTVMLGRVVAITRMLAFASIPVASITAGALEGVIQNMYLIMALGAVFRVAVGVLGIRGPLNDGPGKMVQTAASI